MECRAHRRKTYGTRSGDGLRNYNFSRFYGLKPGDYERMLAEQDGLCLICLNVDDSLHQKLAVDHCHITGRVRGLLCHKCNKGLGQFLDNPLLLRLAADYSEKA